MLGIEIGVGLNIDSFRRGMDAVGRALKNFGSSFAGQYLGADMLIRIAGAVKDAFLSGLETVRTAKIGALKMGVDKQTFQQINNALSAGGSDAEQFDKALVKLAETMVTAKGTGQEAGHALKK